MCIISPYLREESIKKMAVRLCVWVREKRLYEVLYASVCELIYDVCAYIYDRVKEVIRHGLHKNMYKCVCVCACVSFEHR